MKSRERPPWEVLDENLQVAKTPLDIAIAAARVAAFRYSNCNPENPVAHGLAADLARFLRVAKVLGAGPI